MPKEKIEEIQVDLDPELITDIMRMYVKTNLSKASRSYLLRHLKERQKGDEIGDSTFAALGRSVFNEVLLTALKMEVQKVEALMNDVD